MKTAYSAIYERLCIIININNNNVIMSKNERKLKISSKLCQI